MNTNFQAKKVREENTSYKCFLLIVLDSVITVYKKYYLQTLLEKVEISILQKYTKR